MLIGGIESLSLQDFPGKIAAILFTQGCPFRCSFCHNPHLVEKKFFEKPISEEKVFSFLESRKAKLDGVVITGGEPTLHADLFSWIQRIKEMGFLVKVDTSGIYPHIVEKLLLCVDYIAMDIKAPIEKYEQIVKVRGIEEDITKSIKLILEAPISSEFRTTLVPSFHKEEEILSMAKMITGARLYSLQRLSDFPTLDSSFLERKENISDEILNKYKILSEKYVKNCRIL